MTIIEMGNWFDLLQDKYGSPYFTDTEKSLLFNRAQVGYVKNLLWPDGNEQPETLELTQDTFSQVAPLIFALPYIQMTSGGLITKTTLQTSLTNTQPGAIVWRPLSIGWTLGGNVRPISFVRHNDWWAFQQNYFKAPTTENPKFRETAAAFEFLPVSISARVYFTVLKYPITVNLDYDTPANNINSDLPDFTHDKIVALALEYAGISSRDEALAQLVQLKK
jgi:hypothetical protein